MIDAHHHFWRYNTTEYDWIGDDMSALQRDFMPADLKNEVENAGISGVVSVQARQTLEETRALLDYAAANEWILGVVGWMPLASPYLEATLEDFANRQALKGVRHVVQGEAPGFLNGIAFNQGVAQLKKFDLVYDLLIFQDQLPEAIEFVDRHPDQVFVLDHIAKPRIQDGEMEPWTKWIGELARRENVFCKVSGLVTEANWQTWTPENLKPYFDVVLSAFGPSRLMFGSDWPVCLAACGYARWAQIVRDWAAPLSSEEKACLFEGTARRAYQLAP